MNSDVISYEQLHTVTGNDGKRCGRLQRSFLVNSKYRGRAIAGLLLKIVSF